MNELSSDRAAMASDGAVHGNHCHVASSQPGVGVRPQGNRPRICVVKASGTYDLFTVTGPALAQIVSSSNMRSGPIGLWEAFDCEARIVSDDNAPECAEGRKQWRRYVEGWEYRQPPSEPAESVDWSQYDIVISIDIAVPTRIVRLFPTVMWCHYFIEGGPNSVKGYAAGSPLYGYNVFITQRLGKARWDHNSVRVRQMRWERRSQLDAPLLPAILDVHLAPPGCA